MHAPQVWGGGLETHIHLLTVELLSRGIEVTLAVCPKFGQHTGNRRELSMRGADFLNVGESAHGRLNKTVNLASLRPKIGDLGRFGVIVCHGVGMSHMVATAGRHNARLVWHDHYSGGETISNEQEFSPPGLKRYPWPFRLFLDKVDAVITGSQRGCGNLLNFQLVKSQIHVIPPLCCLPAPQKHPWPQRLPTITCGTFGTLSPQKGTERLLRLWTHPELRHIRLLLFGNDHDGKYERLAESLSLRNVEFRGPYSEGSFAQNAAEVDFAIITSIVEGYPLVAIELMACGVPFVATNVGACAELAGDSSEIILMEHDAESVLSAVLQMVNQIEKGAVDRDAIRQRAIEIYDRECIVERHLQVICGK